MGGPLLAFLVNRSCRHARLLARLAPEPPSRPASPPAPPPRHDSIIINLKTHKNFWVIFTRVLRPQEYVSVRILRESQKISTLFFLFSQISQKLDTRETGTILVHHENETSLARAHTGAHVQCGYSAAPREKGAARARAHTGAHVQCGYSAG